MTQRDSIEAALHGYVDAGALAGAATLVWRGGRVVQTAIVGRRDLVTNLPVERDTIFRIASMSKPVTSAAALTLYDEGRFALDEPITRLAPELAHLRVLRDPNGPLEQTDAAERPITFGDLLTHRSGLTYGELHRGPISRACAQALGATMDNALGPDEWIARLATLPLIDQPGAGFHYGLSTDLLGFLIARLEDAPLGDVLERRIFRPLGMRDTGFVVPREKRARRAGLCGFDAEGKLAALTTVPGGHALAERPDDMTFESGGQGLWSTLDDYLAFARIFLGRGEVDGVRLLRPETCAMMASNQLTPPAADSSNVGQVLVCGGPRIWDGRCRGDGTGQGGSLDVSRRCRDCRMARRVWRLVASGPERQLRPDISDAQHGGAAANGEWHRSGRVERHREVPRARHRLMGTHLAWRAKRQIPRKAAKT